MAGPCALLRAAGLLASELLLNTDWQNENRPNWGVVVKTMRVHCKSLHAWRVSFLSSSFLNLDLLATNGETLGASIASI